MKFIYFLLIAFIFTSCNLIRILQMSEPNDESAIEVNRFIKKYKYDYSLFADDSKSWMQKTKMYGINNDTTKYSYVQLRIYNRDGSLYSAYSQCMGDFNKKNFVDSFPLKRNDYPFINKQLKFNNEMDLLDLSTETKEKILLQTGNYKFTYVVYYSIWTNYASKHVLKEVSKIKSKKPNDVMIVLVNLARNTN